MKNQFAKVRLSEAELDKLRARANAQGISVSALLRECAIEQHRTDAMEDQSAQIRRVQQQLDATGAALAEVLALVREIIGRHDPQAVARIAAANKRPTTNGAMQ